MRINVRAELIAVVLSNRPASTWWTPIPWAVFCSSSWRCLNIVICQKISGSAQRLWWRPQKKRRSSSPATDGWPGRKYWNSEEQKVFHRVTLQSLTSIWGYSCSGLIPSDTYMDYRYHYCCMLWYILVHLICISTAMKEFDEDHRLLIKHRKTEVEKRGKLHQWVYSAFPVAAQ